MGLFFGKKCKINFIKLTNRYLMIVTIYMVFFFISNYLKIKEISLDVTIYMVIFCICASFYYPHDQNNKHIYILLYKMIKWQSIMSASVCIFLSVCSVLVDIIKKTLRFLSSSFLNISKTLLLWLQNFLQILKMPKKNGVNASFFCFHITNVNTLNFVHVSSI